MKIIIINSDDFMSREQLHDVLKDKFNFPDYYGKNLDALWDCLTDYVEPPLVIKWKNYKKSKSELGDYAEKVLAIFKQVANKYKDINIVIS